MPHRHGLQIDSDIKRATWRGGKPTGAIPQKNRYVQIVLVGRGKIHLAISIEVRSRDESGIESDRNRTACGGCQGACRIRLAYDKTTYHRRGGHKKCVATLAGLNRTGTGCQKYDNSARNRTYGRNNRRECDRETRTGLCGDGKRRASENLIGKRLERDRLRSGGHRESLRYRRG